MTNRPLKPLLLICLTTVLSACHDKKIETEEPAGPVVHGEEVEFPADSPKFRQIAISEAKKGAELARHFYGRVSTNEEVTVRVFSPVFGRVNSVLVDIGQPVHAGDVLARLESPDMAQAQSDARKAASDVNAKTHIFLRNQELVRAGSASVQDLEGSQNDMLQAQAEKTRADVKLTQLYGNPGETLDGTYPLKSPISGFVVDRNLNVGQEIRPDQQLANAPNFVMPVFVVTDPKNLWVMVDATERDLPNLHPGDTLSVQSTSFPGKKFPGKILKVGEMLDPLTRTVKVRGSVENLGDLLKPEIYVNVDIIPAGGKTAVEVPSKAVLFVDGKRYIFLEKKPGTYERREVEVADDHDDIAAITKGLSVGEHVVEDGGLYLQAILDNADG